VHFGLPGGVDRGSARNRRDHNVADGLNFVATWNASMKLSGNLDEAIAAQREKRTPNFAD
jgi:enoyl-CoA hydratase